MKKFLLLLAVTALLAGCQTPPAQPAAPKVLLPADRAAFQTMIYTGKLDAVFAATIAVLQDVGWKLESVEVDLPEAYRDLFDRIEKALRLRL
jgi:uncharacterized protein YceK